MLCTNVIFFTDQLPTHHVRLPETSVWPVVKVVIAVLCCAALFSFHFDSYSSQSKARIEWPADWQIGNYVNTPTISLASTLVLTFFLFAIN